MDSIVISTVLSMNFLCLVTQMIPDCHTLTLDSLDEAKWSNFLGALLSLPVTEFSLQNDAGDNEN